MQLEKDRDILYQKIRALRNNSRAIILLYFGIDRYRELTGKIYITKNGDIFLIHDNKQFDGYNDGLKLKEGQYSWWLYNQKSDNIDCYTENIESCNLTFNLF